MTLFNDALSYSNNKNITNLRAGTYLSVLV